MARWEITIADPSNTYGSVYFKPGGDSYNRSIFEEISVNRFTSRNTAILTGNKTGYRYVWSISALTIPINDLRVLEGLIRLVMEGTRTHLLLTDEVEELSPEISPHKKTLIATPSTVNGLVYGFGRFAVVPQRVDQNPRKHLGYIGDREFKSINLQFIEIPNIVV